MPVPKGTKGPKSGRPMTPVGAATAPKDGKTNFPGSIANSVSKPANAANLYQEGNMSPNPPHHVARPDSAVSQVLPGGTSTSSDT
jgi:hypothetical protein